MIGIAIGKLRHYADLEQLTAPSESGRTALGAQVPDWKAVAKVWACIEPIGGSRTWHNDQLRADVTHTITMRYRAGLDPKRFRIKHQGRVYNLDAALDLGGRNTTMKLTAIEVVA